MSLLGRGAVAIPKIDLTKRIVNYYLNKVTPFYEPTSIIVLGPELDFKTYKLESYSRQIFLSLKMEI